jgi:hypothetical protein
MILLKISMKFSAFFLSAAICTGPYFSDAFIVNPALNRMSELTKGGRLSLQLPRPKPLVGSRMLQMLSSVTKPTVELHQGMKDIADNYDAFLLDQWGVLHDGKIAYDGAVHCLNELLSRGKLIVLLSNSSKRLGNSMKKLDSMGIDR